MNASNPHVTSVVNYVVAVAAAIALTAAVASSAMAQTTSAGTSTSSVAAQTGAAAAAGAVSAGKQALSQPAAVPGKTRAQVQAEFIEARKNGLVPETEADFDVAQTRKHIVH